MRQLPTQPHPTLRPRHAAALAAGLTTLVVIVGAIASGAAARSGAQGAGLVGGDRPNFLLVTTDDQTVRDLSVMPTTKALIGRKGVTFKRAYASYPLCCPSRVTMLTGRYTHNHGVLANDPPAGGYGRLIGSEKHTLPVWLDKAGYRSIHIGKMPNGYGAPSQTALDHVPPGWSEFYGFRPRDPAGQPEPRCRSSAYIDFCLNEDPDGRDGPLPVKRVQYLGGYQTDVYAARAAERIAAHFSHPVTDNSPLYMQVHFFAPHAPATAATRHEGAFASAPLPKEPGFNEADVSDKPKWLRSSVGRMGSGLISQIANLHRKRLASLLAVDEGVAQIIAALADEGELGNTYVVFASDNAFFQGQHRLHQGKFLAHEPSARIPMMMRGPGIPAGVRSHELVMNTDIVPTVVGIAGAKPSRSQDGRSLLPFARKAGLETTRPLLLESGAAIAKLATASGQVRASKAVKSLDQEPTATAAFGRDIAAPRYSGIRIGRYVWIEYTDRSRELYDLATDRFQLYSRHSSLRYKRPRRWLKAALSRLESCTGRPCRLAIGKPPKPLPKAKRRR
jgi:N-acetylglucosamine-6-sulfatase